MAREEKLVQVVRRSLNSVCPGRVPQVLVALSGGVDSVALLGVMRILLDAGRLNAQVMHVDHGVREESAKESAAVIEFARAQGFEVLATRLEDDIPARFPGVGVEESLRRGRYLAFARFLAAAGGDLIALGHHQQDQAETVLMHILRGAGMRGAGGMREFSQLEVPWWPGESEGVDRRPLPLWRPFLYTPKAALQEFVERHDLPVWEDPSNESREFRRNAIRHDVLPLLDEIYPGTTGTVARFGQILGEDDAELDAMASAAFGALISDPGLPRDVFQRQSAVIRRRMLRLWILQHARGLELSFDRVNAVVEAVIHARERKVIELGEGWSVIVEKDVVRIEQAGELGDT